MQQLLSEGIYSPRVSLVCLQAITKQNEVKHFFANTRPHSRLNEIRLQIRIYYPMSDISKSMFSSL